MSRQNFITGRTADEKFKSVNKTLQHLARRSHKSVGVHVPPTLISSYIDTPKNGVIHKQIFPVAGTLANVCCLFEKLPEKTSSVDVEVSIKYPNHSGEKVIFPGKKVMQKAKIDKVLPAGTMVTICLVDASVECSGVWLSATFTMDIKATKLHTVIMDELEASYDRLQEHISADEGVMEQEKPSTELSELIDSVKS